MSYTRNNLNQYTKIEHPGTFDVMGRAPAGWEIEVEYPTGTTHYPATDGSRQGERFRVELSYDNETNDASLESVVVRGDEDDPIPDPPDVEKTVKQWVPNNGAVFGSSPM